MDENKFFNSQPDWQTNKHINQKKKKNFAYIKLTQYKPSSLMHQLILAYIKQ